MICPKWFNICAGSFKGTQKKQMLFWQSFCLTPLSSIDYVQLSNQAGLNSKHALYAPDKNFKDEKKYTS